MRLSQQVQGPHAKTLSEEPNTPLWPSRAKHLDLVFPCYFLAWSLGHGSPWAASVQMNIPPERRSNVLNEAPCYRPNNEVNITGALSVVDLGSGRMSVSHQATYHTVLAPLNLSLCQLALGKLYWTCRSFELHYANHVSSSRTWSEFAARFWQTCSMRN